MADSKNPEDNRQVFVIESSDGINFRLIETATLDACMLDQIADASGDRKRCHAAQSAIKLLSLVESSSPNCSSSVMPLSSLNLTKDQWAWAAALASAIAAGVLAGYTFMAKYIIWLVGFMVKYGYVPTFILRWLGFGYLGPMTGGLAAAAQAATGNVGPLPGAFAACQQAAMVAGDVVLTAAEVKVLIAAGVVVVIGGAALYAYKNNLHVEAYEKLRLCFQSKM